MQKVTPNFKDSNIIKLITPVLFLVFFLSCTDSNSNKRLSSNKLGLDTTADTYSVTAEDLSMNLAIKKAKRTISEFDQALKSGNPSYTDFAVKKRYNSSGGGGEHMWIGRIALKDGNYKGIVNNNAEKTIEVKYGDSVIVHKDELTDWMYLDKNILRGGYTIREIRNHMSKEERIQMDKNLGFKIED